jgi:hypothetical protein
MVEERRSVISQAGRAATAPLKQWLAAEFVFQRLDMRTDRGLGDAKPISRGRKAAGLSHGNKDFNAAHGRMQHFLSL